MRGILELGVVAWATYKTMIKFLILYIKNLKWRIMAMDKTNVKNVEERHNRL
jgi:hypothetical protein